MDKKLSWPFGRRAFIFRNWGANHHSEAAAWRVSPSEPRRDAPRDGPARLGAPRALQAPRGPPRARSLAPPARPLACRHRRRRGVTPGRDVRSHPREVLAHPERGRGDRAARRGHPRDARETGGPARAGGAAEGGRGPHGHRGGGHPGAGAAARRSRPTAATTRPTVASDPSSSSVASSASASVSSWTAPRSPTARGRRPGATKPSSKPTTRRFARCGGTSRVRSARGGGGVGGKDGVVQVGQRRDGGVPTGGAGAGARGSAKKASGSRGTTRTGSSEALGEEQRLSDDADEDGAFGPAPKSLFASYLGRYGAGGSFLTPSASKLGSSTRRRRTASAS